MAITYINSTALTIGTAASTWSIPTHSSIEGGAAFIVGIGPASSVVTVSAITDSAGNTYAVAVVRGTPKPTAGAELWYATNISSQSTRISVTLSDVSSGSIAVAQFRGISTANALLNTGSSATESGPGSTDHSASQITPTEANAVVVSYGRLTASTLGTVTVQGGMTAWTSTGDAVRQVGAYIIQGAASTVTGSWTTSSRAAHAAVLAAFSDTGAAAVASPWFGGYMRLGMGM